MITFITMDDIIKSKFNKLQVFDPLRFKDINKKFTFSGFDRYASNNRMQ